ncbi:unnamed protein product, partial [Cyprideis torosa]
MTLYTTYKEKSTFLVALEKDPAGVDPPDVWRASSRMKRFDDQYSLDISVARGKSGAVKETTYSKTVAAFFDTNG